MACGSTGCSEADARQRGRRVWLGNSAYTVAFFSERPRCCRRAVAWPEERVEAARAHQRPGSVPGCASPWHQGPRGGHSRRGPGSCSLTAVAPSCHRPAVGSAIMPLSPWLLSAWVSGEAGETANVSLHVTAIPGMFAASEVVYRQIGGSVALKCASTVWHSLRKARRCVYHHSFQRKQVHGASVAPFVLGVFLARS